jgi:hypothetical protein
MLASLFFLLSVLLMPQTVHASDPCNPPAADVEDLSILIGLIFEETTGSTGFCPDNLDVPMDTAEMDSRASQLAASERDAAAVELGHALALVDPSRVQALANGAALLDALLGVAIARREDLSAYIDALIALARGSQDPLLRRQIALNLWRRSITDDRAMELLREFLPTEPDYAHVLPEGVTRVKAVLQTGSDGFKHSDFEAVFKNVGAKVEKLGSGSDLRVEYTVTPDDPSLPAVIWELDIVDGGWPPRHAFDNMDDPDKNVAMFGNHSQLGTSLDSSLKPGAKPSDSTDFYWVDACKSKVFASRITQAYPQGHFVYTKNSEYFHDMARAFQRGLVALTNHYDYEQMRRYVASGSLMQGKNYLFPDDENKFAYLDQDGDGISDAEDRIYDAKPAFNGELASRAVHVANTYAGYSGAYSGTEDLYRPGGVFKGEAGGALTRIEQTKDAYGKNRYFVQVSDQLLSKDQTERTAQIAHDVAKHWGEKQRWSKEKTEAGAFLVGAAVYDVWGGSGWDSYVSRTVPDAGVTKYDVSKYLDDHDFVTSSKLSEFQKYLSDKRKSDKS